MIIHALFLNNFLGLRDMLLLLITMILLQLCERMPNPMGESAVDCESVPSMPTVAFTIGGKEFELAPEEVLYLNSSLTIDAPPLYWTCCNAQVGEMQPANHLNNEVSVTFICLL